MIDQNLLAKIPKKYQPIIVGLRRGEGSSYWIKLKEEYEFKGWWTDGDFYEFYSFATILKMLHQGLNIPIPNVKRSTKENSDFKSKCYKMVSIRMTEEEKIEVIKFLAELRKQNNKA